MKARSFREHDGVSSVVAHENLNMEESAVRHIPTAVGTGVLIENDGDITQTESSAFKISQE